MNDAEAYLCWNAIIEKVSTSDIGILTDDERTVYLVNKLLYDFESGGLSGALYSAAASFKVDHARYTALRNSYLTEFVERALRALVNALNAESTSAWSEMLQSAGLEHVVSEEWQNEFEQHVEAIYTDLAKFTAERLALT